MDIGVRLVVWCNLVHTEEPMSIDDPGDGDCSSYEHTICSHESSRVTCFLFSSATNKTYECLAPSRTVWDAFQTCWLGHGMSGFGLGEQIVSRLRHPKP